MRLFRSASSALRHRHRSVRLGFLGGAVLSAAPDHVDPGAGDRGDARRLPQITHRSSDDEYPWCSTASRRLNKNARRSWPSMTVTTRMVHP